MQGPTSRCIGKLDDGFSNRQTLIYTRIHLAIIVFKLKYISNMLTHELKVWLALMLLLFISLRLHFYHANPSSLGLCLYYYVCRTEVVNICCSFLEQIPPTLCFSLKILMKVTHRSNVWPFLLWYKHPAS